MKSAENQKLLQSALQKLNQGKASTAAKLAVKGLKKFPKDVDLFKVAGLSFSQSGQHQAAAKAYSDLLRLTPDAQDVKMSLGLALVQANRSDLARTRVAQWVQDTPESAAMWYLSAVVASDQGDLARADHDASRALTHDPQMEGALATRGLARFNQEQFESALTDFQTADALNPNLPETLLNIGHCQQALHQWDKAIETFQKCTALTPDDVATRSYLAVALGQGGNLEAAKAEHQRILELAPNHWPSIASMVELLTDAEKPAMESHIHAALKSVKRGSDDEIYATMTLANLLDGMGRWDAALPYFQRSNALHARRSPYAPEGMDALRARMINAFPSDHTSAADGDINSPTPIFVIGQPRSGTTLTDMIISAHPDVSSLGELGIDEDLIEKHLGQGGFDPAAFAKSYRLSLPDTGMNSSYFVDKMPANYMFVGLLADAFPKARFINIARDPRDVALSMWKRHFLGHYNTYCADLTWMAHAANTYKRYMQHWNTLYGDRILTVNYTDLAGDTEATARQLAEFCGLPWDDAMAHPERNTARVRTASTVQVRQKTHSKSIGGWVKRKDFLAPFTAALDPALWPEVAD